LTDLGINVSESIGIKAEFGTPTAYPKWRIYYGDGSTYSDLMGAPEDAPTRNVQIIIQEHIDTGWYIQPGDDYYVWTGDHWVGVDRFGLYDYLIEPGWKKVIFGRTLTNTEYKAIYRQAQHDKSLMPKSAMVRGERKP
jgi:hypothetical protein